MGQEADAKEDPSDTGTKNCHCRGGEGEAPPVVCSLPKKTVLGLMTHSCSWPPHMSPPGHPPTPCCAHLGLGSGALLDDRVTAAPCQGWPGVGGGTVQVWSCGFLKSQAQALSPPGPWQKRREAGGKGGREAPGSGLVDAWQGSCPLRAQPQPLLSSPAVATREMLGSPPRPSTFCSCSYPC